MSGLELSSFMSVNDVKRQLPHDPRKPNRGSAKTTEDGRGVVNADWRERSGITECIASEVVEAANRMAWRGLKFALSL